MTTSNSIFHRIQKEGTKSLAVPALRDGFTIDLGPFANRLSPHIMDPYPVYTIDWQDANLLNARFTQIMAQQGLDMAEIVRSRDTLDPDDFMAGLNLYHEELHTAKIPSPRFGVEFNLGNGAVMALACEARRDKTHVYSFHECKDMRLADCEFLYVNFLTAAPTTSESYSGKTDLSDVCGLIHPRSIRVANAIENYWGTFNLSSDNFKVTKHPPVKKETKLTLDGLFEPRDINETKLVADGIIDAVNHLFVCFWILAREPLLAPQTNETFEETNKLRRQRRMAPLSSIHRIRIDQDELRRLESTRASEIETALRTKGGYKIPGLVLVGSEVGGYERPSTGQWVNAHARCADDVVRNQATKLLQTEPVDFNALAELVWKYGQRTLEDHPISDLHQLKIVAREDVTDCRQRRGALVDFSKR
jgi:hypothetical protein